MCHKRYGLTVLLWIVLCFDCARWSLSRAESPSGTAVVAARRLVYDFGEVASGQEVVHIFHIRNDSGRTIDIVSVKPDCFCTTVSTVPKQLPPSGADLTVTFRPSGMAGSRVQSVVVQLRGEIPYILTLRGSVVDLCPVAVQFGQIKRGENVRRVFVARTLPSQGVTVTGVEYDRALLTVKLRVVDETATEVSVETNGAIPDGPFDIPLTMRLSGPTGVGYHTRLRGHVLRAIEADKERLFLSPPNENGDMVGRVRLFSPYGEDIVVRSVQSETLENLTAIRLAANDNKSINLDVRYHVAGHQTNAEFVSGAITVVADVAGTRNTREIHVLGLATGARP